ncbi:MAG: 30S ribosomal protein S2 [Nitrososphaerota archaeon]|nr:30S ribosomal protein S2 [Nitrososphaerota archaeon]MDG6939539.1 30S ribosomal protein S2 [Nitrososphaerota archaeon]
MITSQLSEKTLVSTGIRIGTTVKTKYMTGYVAKTRSDGLHLIDVNRTLSRIEVVGKFISRFTPANVAVYTARDFAKTPIEKFCELTGCKGQTGRFMPGTFTNPQLPFYTDTDMLLVVDPALDKQAIVEASSIGIPVVAVADTDNSTEDVDIVIPANNRGRRSLAALFWLLARSVLIHSSAISADQPIKYTIEEFETKLVAEEGEAEA